MKSTFSNRFWWPLAAGGILLGQCATGAPLPNAWQVNDNSTASGGALNYTINLTTAQRIASTNSSGGFRYRINARFVDRLGGTRAIVVGYGLGDHRFFISFDLNPSGDLTATLEGASTITLTTNGTGTAFYHTHEILYNPVARTASYLVDGLVQATNWTASAIAYPAGLIVWGSGSSPNRGRMNFHEVKFEITGLGIVAAYDAGTQDNPPVASSPVSQGWTSTPLAPPANVTVGAISPDTSLLPTAITLPASTVGFDSAVLRGSVTGKPGLPNMVWFEYGSSGNLNLVTPVQILPPEIGAQMVSASVMNLSFSPFHQFRLVAANEYGTNYGATQEFLLPVPGARSALEFDGSNDTVNLGSSNALKITGTTGTWEAWIRPTSYRDMIILNKEGEYEIAMFANGQLWWALSITNPNWQAIQTGIIPPLNRWTHVAFVYNGANMILYTNGVAARTNAPASGPIGDEFTSHNELRVGSRQNLGTPSSWWHGGIDDVRVWNVARSAAEIAASYNRSLIIPATGLLVYLKFDEGSGNTAINLGLNIPGTLAGGPSGPLWGPSAARIIDPVPVTLPASPVLATSATLRGTVNPSGENVVSYFEYGTTTAYGTHTELRDRPGSLTTLSLSAPVAGLEPGTTYHYRMVARSTVRTNYGANQTFTTLVLGSGWPVSTKLTGGEASSPLHVLDGLGNTLVAGVFSGSASFRTPLSPQGGATANAFVGKMSRSADWVWTTNIPASANGFTSIRAMALDADRNVYVAGQFSGTNTFGSTQLISANDTNLFVAKIDSNGTNWLWARAVGGVGTDSANAIAVVGTNIFVAGSFSGTANFIVSNLFSVGSSDAFVASLDNNGNWLWANRAGGAGLDLVSTLATDTDTNIYVAGQFSAAAMFGSTPTATLTNAGGSDLFVAKLTRSGSWLLARRGGSANNDMAVALVREASQFYLVGQFGGVAEYGVPNLNSVGGTNIFVLRLNTDAGYQDYIRGGAGSVRSASVDSLGRLYVAGDFPFTTSFGTNTLFSSGNSDVFIAQLADGEWAWAKRIGAAGMETAGSLAADSDNSVVISGTYQGTIQIGYAALSSPNNQDIFVARLGADQIYEHNNYIVGQAIPVPVDAQDSSYGDGAIGLPRITILERDHPDSRDDNSFVWSVSEHKLFPVRRVTAIFKWPLTTNLTNETAVVTAIGRISYPTNPVIHIANAPVELEPAVAGFPLRVAGPPAFATTNASVDLSTKIFSAPNPGWTVLQFVDTGGEPINPAIPQPMKFEVVRTTNWNDPQLLQEQSVEIGTALSNPDHNDPTLKNGFVLFEKALYDGAGDERAHDRASRTGPIIPVNRKEGFPMDDLVVVWYRVSGNGIAWPNRPVRYQAQWPTHAPELVLSSRIGSGPLPIDFLSKRVYRQPNPQLPGFNPNEEHAALYGDTLYALRNDLNSAPPKASEPYTLLKYLDPVSGEWAMTVYKVVMTNAAYPLVYSGVAGQELVLPEPLNFLSLCHSSNRVVWGPGFQDYIGRLYARAAGAGANDTNIIAQYWYPLQAEFDGMTNVSVGTCIPWLDRRTGGVSGTPVDIAYHITWPAGVPRLALGETWFGARPGPTNASSDLNSLGSLFSAHVIYDQGDPFATNALESLVRLFDPVGARTQQLALDFVLPATIATVSDAGLRVFSDLPYSLRSRLRYDNLKQQFIFSGLINESVDYGGPNNPLLLINVLSPRESDRIKQLSTDTAFRDAIDDLYDLTRNPNRLDADGDGQPDRRLLIGLAYSSQTNGPRIMPEQLGSGPKALTAGTGTGSGYVTVVENNDPGLAGFPVTLHVIEIAGGPFRGEIKVLYPDNVFDQKLTLRHSGDFGGEPQRFEFEWYYMPDDPSLNHTVLPTVDANGAIVALNGWTNYPGIPPGANGFNDVTLGDLGPSGLLVLADHYYICRYRGYVVNGETNWTDWLGSSTGDTAKFVQGWVKRVLAGLGPFNARTDAFHENATVTFASMLQQAGPRFERDVDPSGPNINTIGLIEAYETVLRRARSLSVNAGINYPAANNALLLAASRISDFYILLGNEAYADAADPTIGFRTDAAGYGTLAPSIFTFQNQLDSLLEEELVLLRGRDDRSATVRSAPVYNRLFWNFTQAEGEVAYAQAYNITDQNSDGFINASDARVMYPQGHGDAWGHYLTATKTYYALLQSTNFDWEPRSETLILAGNNIEVDYQDERKFARAAAAKAKTGAEIVDLTYRISYVDDPEGQFQGYKDTDANRAWGLSEWAHRAGSAAFFDWVLANAVLPAVDSNTNHVGIQKIDRTTVLEPTEIVSGYESVQAQVDKADAGLNPLGLAKNVVPFDIDPSQIAAGKTHFEQIYERAIESMNNTVTVFNHANQLSQSLRALQDTVNDFSRNAEQQERDFKNRLIEIFGYPYAGDIGPGKTYPPGYDGPDLYHHFYANTVELNADTAPPSQSFTGFFTPGKFGLTTTLDTRVGTGISGFGSPNHQFFFPEDIGGNPGSRLETDILQVSYPMTAADYGFTAPASWGQRRAPGELQLALSSLLQSEARLKQTVANYDNLIQQIESMRDLLQERYNLEAEEMQIENQLAQEKRRLLAVIVAAKIISAIGKSYYDTAAKLNEICLEGIPKVAGTATDVTAPTRAMVKAALYAGTKVFGHMQTLGQVAEEAAKAGQAYYESIAANSIEIANFEYEIRQKVAELETLIRQEAPLRLEVFEMAEVMQKASGEYAAKLAEGERLIDERIAFRKDVAADTQSSRYQDMTFRIFRNDAIQKYRAQYDLAAQYVFLAAVAYDYETQLLGGRSGAGRQFLTDVIRQRSLGQMENGVPVAGRHGLADPLARLGQNFAVLKGQLGFNNPQTETGRFSLRSELLRIGTNSHEAWRAELKDMIVPNLWDVPEFRRYCRPFAPESAGPQPGLVIRFSTTVTFGLNYFGRHLGGGDNNYDPTLFATKVRSAGIWFSDYNGSGLSLTPRVYLVPVGADVMRSPSGNNLETRQWRVVDQKIPVPFPIGFSSLNNTAWIPMNDSLSDTFADIRRFSSFRAFHDSGVFDSSETISDSRLIGRSVWNTDWMLIIPGGTFLFDPNQGLDTFINSVGDIKIFFQTYAYSGN